ncbi:MAG TPA: hypothetical protein VFB22_14060 [Candidatus Baltobacteraceae bacterium]|nr:hypothetical protein [Candidatus Baltobacteraceae bacterium]
MSWTTMRRLLGDPTTQSVDDGRRYTEMLRWACGCTAHADTLRFYDVAPCAAHASAARAAAFVSSAMIP